MCLFRMWALYLKGEIEAMNSFNGDDRFREVDNSPSRVARRFVRFCGCAMHVRPDAPNSPTLEDVNHVITCPRCAGMHENNVFKILEECHADPAYREWYFNGRGSFGTEMKPDA